jgi:hypothetical protein
VTIGSALVAGLVVAIADGDTLTLVDENCRQVRGLQEIDAPRGAGVRCSIPEAIG